MTEVYKALKAIGCTWYAVNNYRILCMWKSAPQSMFPYGRTTVPDLPSSLQNRPNNSHINSNKRQFESTITVLLL